MKVNFSISYIKFYILQIIQLFSILKLLTAYLKSVLGAYVRIWFSDGVISECIFASVCQEVTGLYS